MKHLVLLIATSSAYAGAQLPSDPAPTRAGDISLRQAKSRAEAFLSAFELPSAPFDTKALLVYGLSNTRQWQFTAGTYRFKVDAADGQLTRFGDSNVDDLGRPDSRKGSDIVSNEADIRRLAPDVARKLGLPDSYALQEWTIVTDEQANRGEPEPQRGFVRLRFAPVVRGRQFFNGTFAGIALDIKTGKAFGLDWRRIGVAADEEPRISAEQAIQAGIEASAHYLTAHPFAAFVQRDPHDFPCELGYAISNGMWGTQKVLQGPEPHPARLVYKVVLGKSYIFVSAVDASIVGGQIEGG